MKSNNFKLNEIKALVTPDDDMGKCQNVERLLATAKCNSVTNQTVKGNKEKCDDYYNDCKQW